MKETEKRKISSPQGREEDGKDGGKQRGRHDVRNKWRKDKSNEAEERIME